MFIVFRVYSRLQGSEDVLSQRITIKFVQFVPSVWLVGLHCGPEPVQSAGQDLLKGSGIHKYARVS